MPTAQVEGKCNSTGRGISVSTRRLEDTMVTRRHFCKYHGVSTMGPQIKSAPVRNLEFRLRLRLTTFLCPRPRPFSTLHPLQNPPAHIPIELFLTEIGM